MATILQVIQEAAKRTGLPSPSTVIGNTDENVICLLSFMTQAAKEIRSDTEWAEMQKEHVFQLSASVDAYQLPPDFDSMIFETLWNRDNYWPLRGPVTPEQWQAYKSGSLAPVITQQFRVKGWQTEQFFIDPMPSLAEDGMDCVFEYQSQSWIRPTTVWSAGSVAAATTYRYYNGNIYYTTAGGTTGGQAPTHTLGSESDGAVTWTAVSYQEPLVDTDVVLIDSELLIEGIRWRFKREKGLDYQSIQQLNENQIRSSSVNLKGATTVNFCRRRRGYLIGYGNVPEGNWPDS